MNVNEVRHILERNKNDIAFIIGNGINRHYNKDNISWSDLLLDLWKKHSFNTQSIIPKGISFTEFYDALEIENFSKTNFSSLLQKDVAETMEALSPNTSQNLILEKIEEIDAPLLTTNFDDLIPKSLNLQFNKIPESKFTDYYPWSSYYSNRELEDPSKGFGVWFPNGMIKYQRSIKLGLSQYMGNVERARKLLHNQNEKISFEGKNKDMWKGHNTWLHIIFNKSLFICGLSLDESEIFLRWLLIERAKYFRKFPDRQHNGWYITKKDNSLHRDGKIFFLKSVGFEVIELDEYESIYEGIWS